MGYIIPVHTSLPRAATSKDDVLRWAQAFSNAYAGDYRKIALRLDKICMQGDFADRPAADGSRRYYWAVDTSALYYDDGAWETIGGGASELSDLSDVNTSTPTNRYALMGNGVTFDSRALVEADISDLDRIQATLIDAAGDLIYGSADDTPARLAIGTGRNLFLSPSAGVPAWTTLTGALDMGIFYAKDFETLAAMFAAGGSNAVYILEANKTYSENVSINLDYIEVKGAGWSTLIDGGAGTAWLSQGDYCYFHDFAVQSTAGGGGVYYGMYCVNCVHAIVERIRVVNSDYDAIRFVNVDHGSIINCLIDNADAFGIYTEGTSSYIHVAGNTILACGGAYGIIINQDYGSVVGNISLAGSTADIRLHTSAQYIACTGNYAADHVISNGGTNNNVGHNT